MEMAAVLPSSWEELPPDLLGLVLHRLPSAPGAWAPIPGGTSRCPRLSRGSPSATAASLTFTGLPSAAAYPFSARAPSTTSPSTT
ncbi:unnamed protein product [Urochloa humidicola]